MKCTACGGKMEWKGPLFALTHKECVRCGSREQPEYDDIDNDEENPENE